MFNNKKPEVITPSKVRTPKPTTPKSTTNNVQRATSSAVSQGKTIISKDCLVKGEMSGTDDISILGKVDGSITLKDSILTVEESGSVKSNIFARVVNVIGNIIGNIDASEKIIIHENGKVTGDMTAPKVILKDGSYLEGNVSMVDSKISKTSTEESAKI
ncbi:MAG: hypothetical protein Ctma_1154 [Catillopecten margaritatus gill symbiont]|uniref:Cell shape determination protein CcmA n=1 Tax=Catillopecten margaritatus gill symbiont TaxID=3083288 RepID=A0AAU6PHD6_9GAMM